MPEEAKPTETPADALPPLLVMPPWLRQRRRVKPVMIRGLARPAEPGIAWLPGEREAWAHAACRYVEVFRTPRDVDRLLDGHRAGDLNWLQEAVLFSLGPVEVVRPLVAGWRPTDVFHADEWGPRIVARFELDALPALLNLARYQPQNAAALLLPYTGPDVADLMADWLTRLKSLRHVALSWLARHPRAAAQALLPAALGRPGPTRRAAEQALRAVLVAGHAEQVTATAADHGEQAVAAVGGILDVDPLWLLPARIPALPDWVDVSSLPRVPMRDHSVVLPPDAVVHVCTMLAMSRPGDVYAGVDVVRQACDPDSLAELGWALFERWRSVGAPAKENWALHALGWVGDDETVRRLTPIIRAWPGEGGHARAVAGLDVLAGIGTDVALMHLNGLARRVKFTGLKERAEQKVAEIAGKLGLSPERLADRLVPDLGLDAASTLTLDYGPRRFVVGFDEQLRPYVADPDGARRAALPKPNARDDADLAPAAYRRFSALKKDVRTLAGDQIRRLEEAMLTGRRWHAGEFRQLLVAHPLLWHLVRRLVWGSYSAGTAGTAGSGADGAGASCAVGSADRGGLLAAFRVAEDRTLADVHDDGFTLDEVAQVGVAHPVQLAGELPAWSELFADYAILQPFPQLGRRTYRLTEEELGSCHLTRFTGAVVPVTKLLGLQRRGWRRGETQDGGAQCWLERPVPDGRTVVVNIDPGITVGYADESPDQRLDDIWISGTSTGSWRATGSLRFGDLSLVTASELVRDLTEVTA